MAIITDLRDPRIEHVTVTYVEVSPDMRQAKVHVSIMGDEKHQERCLKGLQSAAGYLQSKVANRIDTRYTPRIEFVIDQGVKNAAAVARILEQVLPANHDEDADHDATDIDSEAASDDDSMSNDTANSNAANPNTADEPPPDDKA